MTLIEELAQFTSCKELHQWNLMYPLGRITNGVKYLLDKTNTYWLVNIIMAQQPTIRRKFGEEGVFQEWYMVTEYAYWGYLVCKNTAGLVLSRRPVDDRNTDVKDIVLYAVYQENNLVIMLPSEF